jgi:predicted metalloenzyme YecM
MSLLVVTLLISHTCNNNFKARLSILILSKTYCRVISTSPNSRHERLLAGGVSFAEQLLRVDPYFQSFSTSSS